MVKLYCGDDTSGKLAIKGFPAWVMHRGYHGLAMPTWERKIRVIVGWVLNFVLGRDMVQLIASETPRVAFETFASRPRPAVSAPAPAPAPVAEEPKRPTRTRKPKVDEAELPGAKGVSGPALANPAAEPAPASK